MAKRKMRVIDGYATYFKMNVAVESEARHNRMRRNLALAACMGASVICFGIVALV